MERYSSLLTFNISGGEKTLNDVRHVALAAMIAVVVGTSRESRGGRESKVQKLRR